MPFDPNTPRSRDEVLLQAIVSGDSSVMGDPRDREEEFVKAIADKETLPDYSEASEGDVLQIGADGPEWGAPSGGDELFIHYILISSSSYSLRMSVTVVCSTSTPFTYTTLYSYFSTHKTSANQTLCIGVSGSCYYTDNYLIDSIILNSNSQMRFYAHKFDATEQMFNMSESQLVITDYCYSIS